MKVAGLRKALKERRYMKRALESSMLKEARYIPSENALLLTFHNGSVYAYIDVPRSEYVGLINAWSHGTYFNQHIKPRFNFRKINIPT